jgi:hypothetical protein
MADINTDKPTARMPARPGSLPERPQLPRRAPLEARDKLMEVTEDWLFKSVSPSGRRKLLEQHGLISK